MKTNKLYIVDSTKEFDGSIENSITVFDDLDFMDEPTSWDYLKSNF